MSRSPIQVELRGLMTPRERVWAAIQKTPDDFTLMSAQDHCLPMVPLTAVDDYLDCLERGGYIVRISQDAPLNKAAQGAVHFRLVKNQHKAPRLKDDGTPVTMGTATDAMWRCMKILKTFDHHQVANAATLGECQVAVGSAKKYVRQLAIAGYLATVRQGKPGTATVYRLTRNSGPHAPAITRTHVVFDRNTGDSYPLQTAQEVCDGLE